MILLMWKHPPEEEKRMNIALIISIIWAIVLVLFISSIVLIFLIFKKRSRKVNSMENSD
ncbi:MAG: hypothetical protein U9R75_01370 [Candidatus Thermoplasmatota archaeon]|nr:hypothetical protein [Candidatus Thermoplasmatota archaeon]